MSTALKNGFSRRFNSPGGPSLFTKRVIVTVTSTPADKDDLTAAFFGFTVLHECSNFVNEAGTDLVHAGVNAEGDKILPMSTAVGTGGDAGDFIKSATLPIGVWWISITGR